MNFHDSRRIEEILVEFGHNPVQVADDADVVLVNTCTVREKPWHKAISETGRYRKQKHRRKHLRVGLVGCVAQQEGEHIFDLLTGIDFVVSPDNYRLLPDIFEQLSNDPGKNCITGFDSGEPSDFLTVKTVRDTEVSAFVTISKGCEERCHYCIVPDVRGPERHRGFVQIVDEVKQLVERGIREVTLLGQKVNAYSSSQGDFSTLLRQLDTIDGLERLRFTSPHPRHMTTELISLFGKLRTLCPAIHLPVQSGSNSVLLSMGRRYTREHYIDIVERLRKQVPGLSISSDVIVGFPGESETHFAETLSLLDEVAFSSVFSFKYSSRPGTPSSRIQESLVSEREKEDRLHRLHERIDKWERRFREGLVGTTQYILVEGPGRMPSQLTGRAANHQIVNFLHSEDSTVMRGRCVAVEIIGIHPNSLEGRVR